MSHPRLILIDGHALLYRAFYAFPTLTTQNGLIVNAVYGFLRILLSVIKEQKPEYISVCFDMSSPTFRHTQYVGYKAQRKEMPEELQGQIQIVQDIIRILNIPQYAVAGYEADDVIGTLARKVTQEQEFASSTTDVLIVTGDRDAFQLVCDRVHVLFPAYAKRGEQEFDADAVFEKMGVRPDQVIDLKALAGDASDNIPGVKGIGEKTAVRLITEYGSLEAIYEAIANNPQKLKETTVLKGAVLKKLAEGHQDAILSKQLATIDQNVPLQISLQECRVSGYDKVQAIKTFEEYAFKSLIQLLPPDEFEMGIEDALF